MKGQNKGIQTSLCSNLRAGATVLFVMSLLPSMSSVLRTEVKKKKILISWVRWLTCNPSAEKGETGAPCRPLASQSS